MIRAIKDTNTGVVYDWIKTLEDGTEKHVSVPEANWKREQDWTTEEVEALFTGTSINSTTSQVEEAASQDFL